MQRHRDSQKRYYIKNATYFITTVTHGRFPYFEHDFLCQLLVDELVLCQKMKDFTLYGYKINPGMNLIHCFPEGAQAFTRLRGLKH